MSAYCGLCGREFDDAEPYDLVWCSCVSGPSNALAEPPERHREGRR